MDTHPCQLTPAVSSQIMICHPIDFKKKLCLQHQHMIAHAPPPLNDSLLLIILLCLPPPPFPQVLELVCAREAGSVFEADGISCVLRLAPPPSPTSSSSSSSFSSPPSSSPSSFSSPTPPQLHQGLWVPDPPRHAALGNVGGLAPLPVCPPPPSTPPSLPPSSLSSSLSSLSSTPARRCTTRRASAGRRSRHGARGVTRGTARCAPPPLLLLLPPPLSPPLPPFPPPPAGLAPPTLG